MGGSNFSRRQHALSAVAGTVAANYQTCHENAEQLRALQGWVSEMKVATKQ